MPENLINAIISIEDKTFWDHHGFNFWRMGGAIKEYLEGGGQISGTSTITQQLARNVYLSESKSDASIRRETAREGVLRGGLWGAAIVHSCRFRVFVGGLGDGGVCCGEAFSLDPLYR